MLVIDEVGYLGYGPGAADVLFQIVNGRYLKGKPILFTTNKPLRQWGRVLHDEDLARAIIDRTLHHGEHLKLCGRPTASKGARWISMHPWRARRRARTGRTLEACRVQPQAAPLGRRAAIRVVPLRRSAAQLQGIARKLGGHLS